MRVGEGLARFAQIALNLPLDREFTYVVPEHLEERIEVGARVRVPFHGRKLPGIVVGLLVSAGLSRTVSTLLFGIEPTDPVVLVIAASSLAVAGLVASLLPARRALSMDPARSLRSE